MEKYRKMTNEELVETLIYFAEDYGSSATSHDDLEIAKIELPKVKEEILKRLNV